MSSFASFILCAIPASADKPNIVLVLTDDLGWTDTSVPMLKGRPDTASPFYRTPHLGRMARGGMVFSNAYSPAPTCTPSRCSIQFGKTPARLRQTVVHDVLAKSRGIDCRDEVSIASMAKARDPNYVTAHFGKWGFPPRSPEDAGYDVTDGNTNNGDGDFASVRDRTPLPDGDPKRIFSITDRALEFISTQAEAKRPFFLQLSHYAVHVDHMARPSTLALQRKREPGGRIVERDFSGPAGSDNADGLLYAAMIEDLDTGLGMLLDHLEKVGIAENTYVIFTSDNGGGFRGNGPLSGGKANIWEGGIRVPFVVAGPGVRRGAYCDIPVAGWDIWATVHDLIGADEPLPEDLDGGSLRGVFERGNDGEVDRGTGSLIFHFPWYAGHPMTAIRKGDFKVIRSLNTGEARLFDLEKDPGERVNLAGDMPELAASLDAELSRYLKEVDAETIADMRAARREELRGYQGKTDQKITEIKAALEVATSPEQRGELRRSLEMENRRAAIHSNGLRQVGDSEREVKW